MRTRNGGSRCPVIKSALAAMVVNMLLAGCGKLTPYYLQPMPSQPGPPPSGRFQAGFGIADITPPPGVGLAGNGTEGLPAAGWRTRLHARALLMEDADGDRVVFLVADLAHISPTLHRKTATELQQLAADGVVSLAGLSADRLVLAATHSHSGPGHFYSSAVYNDNVSSVGGYDPNMVDFLVRCFVAAIRQAASNLRQARVLWIQEPVWGHTRNRSLTAHQRNKPTWTGPYPPPAYLTPAQAAVDPTWTLVRVDLLDPAGGYQPAGALSIFAMHGTGNTAANDLLDADIHGLVASGLERHITKLNLNSGHTALVPVHLMANGTEGDISPDWPAQSRCGPPELRPTFTHGGPRTPAQVPGWFRPTQALLDRCLAASRDYVNRVADSLVGRVTKIFDAALPMANLDLGVAFSTVELSQLAGMCREPEIGMASLAGADDTRSRLDGWRWLGLFGAGLEEGGSAVNANPSDCHREKRLPPPLIKSVLLKDNGFPLQAQFTAVRLGPLLIGTAPAEITTVAGYQIMAAMRRGASPPGAAPGGYNPAGVALIGLVNGFIQYVTTAEEYTAQHYEGASTLYGPNSAAALAATLGGLANAVATVPVNTVPTFTAFPGKPKSILPMPTGAPPRLGDRKQPLIRIESGGELIARWTGANPGWFYPNEGPVLRFERLEGGAFRTVARDGDVDVEVRLVRTKGNRLAEWEARWTTAPGTGSYRVVLERRSAALPEVESAVVQVP